MMLTTKGRYAVMAAVDMTLHKAEERPVSLADISQRQGITTAYLEQIFSRLKKRNIVSSIRGPGGGYLLTQAASTISIKDIIMAAEEQLKITRCDNKTHRSCTGNNAKCATHELWQGLENHMFAYLESISLYDVAHSPSNFYTSINQTVAA